MPIATTIDSALTGPALTEPPKGPAAPGCVINPYALAEVMTGRRIDWKQVEDKPAMLEQVLGVPYEELFDPKFGGPLYIGGARQEDGSMRAQRSTLLDVEVPKGGDDLERAPMAELGGLATLKDVAKALNVNALDDLAIACIDWSTISRLRITLDLPQAVRDLRMARNYTPDVVRTISNDPALRLGNSVDWSPPGGTWEDAGRFFNETAEFFDPVQGAVANCYFIAALSAIAWSQPYRIAQQTRATGQGQGQFFDRVTFYKPDGQGVDRDIEVSETVPKTAGGFPIYARSSEDGEAWPAIYEKAFAKLKTGTTTDHPDITATGWGDCVWATAQLTGGSRAYYDTASRSADQLWNTLRSNCLSYRTIRPMTAWTYGSGADSPDHVDYSAANVVGSHCYTVLGWAYRNCRRYILLRNPWGSTEATVGSLDATVYAYDVSWWRPIALKDTDGTFAMEIGTFKKYFAGFGVVS
ncbi:C2 family cysteine protease [Piscinibacter terrae]|nr:C2 family cysteine protease [Albitalea terrae]